MLHHLTTIALGPLLLAQGSYARRRTPRLPEPDGLRAGTLGCGPVVRLLVTGDSAAAGVGVTTQSHALSGRLAEMLARDFSVSWSLIARTGYTSREVIQHLQETAAQAFDVAVVSIGVNDVTAGVRPTHWIGLQEQLVDLLRTKFGVRHVLLSSVPPMHQFPALPQPLRWYIGQRAHRLNRELARFTHRREHCEMLSTHFPFETTAMAADGFHPGPAVYSLWAEEAARRIVRRLRA